jgi:O-antigen ligase
MLIGLALLGSRSGAKDRLLVVLRHVPHIGPLLVIACICLVIGSVLVIPHLLKADDSLRASRWQATAQLALHNPLLGAGPGATSQGRVMRELGLGSSASPPDNLIGTRVSESSVLKVAAEIGFPGFVAFGAWLLSVLIRTVVSRPWDRGTYDCLGAAIVILTIVNGLTYQSMESFIGATLFWFGIGLSRSMWIVPGVADQAVKAATWNATWPRSRQVSP